MQGIGRPISPLPIVLESANHRVGNQASSGLAERPTPPSNNVLATMSEQKSGIVPKSGPFITTRSVSEGSGFSSRMALRETKCAV